MFACTLDLMYQYYLRQRTMNFKRVFAVENLESEVHIKLMGKRNIEVAREVAQVRLSLALIGRFTIRLQGEVEGILEDEIQNKH